MMAVLTAALKVVQRAYPKVGLTDVPTAAQKAALMAYQKVGLTVLLKAALKVHPKAGR